MQSYSHFTLTERESLQKLLKEGNNKSQIAIILKRSKSTIVREIKRNSNNDEAYNSFSATEKYIFRRRRCHRKYRFDIDKPLSNFVCKKLELFWSPECIACYYKKKNPNVKLGYSTIYRAIELKLLPNISKQEHLRRRGKQKYGNRSQFNTIKPDYTIHERPIEAGTRSRIGDFESDTVFFKKGCILTAVDRKSRYLLADICDNHLSSTIKNSFLSLFSQNRIQTLTLDNGSEFAKHKEIAKELNIKIYFADPHSPWQRGTNENTNGLLRFFFPKNYDFKEITKDKLKSVVSLLNNRPRKCLGWLTPREVFFKKCCT